MKFKTLRKKDTKEFVVIHINDNFQTIFGVYTTETPVLQPMTATMELYKEFYEKYDWGAYDIDEYELIELDIIDTDAVGADIRNKLSPLSNLISMLKALKTRKLDKEKRTGIKKLIEKEMSQGEISIDYLTNLL